MAFDQHRQQGPSSDQPSRQQQQQHGSNTMQPQIQPQQPSSNASQQQQQQQQQESSFQPFSSSSPTNREREEQQRDRYTTRRSPSNGSYAGPSLPPPSQLPSNMHCQPYPTQQQVDYGRRDPYPPAPSRSYSSTSPQSWDYAERQPYSNHRSLPQTVPPPPHRQQYSGAFQSSHRDYSRSGAPSLPLPVDLGTNNSPFQLPRPTINQPSNTSSSNAPYDPIRSAHTTNREPAGAPQSATTASAAEHALPYRAPPVTSAAPPRPSQVKQEHLSPPQGFHFDRSQAASSPVMSISQLLSSDAPSRPSLTSTPTQPQQQQQHPSDRPSYYENREASYESQPPSVQPAAAIHDDSVVPSSTTAPAPASAPTTPEKPAPIPVSDPAPQPGFRNGIKNLLNNDTEEMYQMADSDTDTEDIPLMPSVPTETPASPDHVSAPKVVVAVNGQAKQSHARQQQQQHNGRVRPRAGRRRRYELSDDSSAEEFSEHDGHRVKTLTERTLEELDLSDDDDDEEIFNTHREEMVQYMIDVYRRKQNVIEEYENKRAHRHALISNHLQRIYEKRYGSELKQQTNGVNSNETPVSSTAALLLQAAREDKERQRRKHKKAKHGHKRMVNEETEETEEQVMQPKEIEKTASERLEDARRAVWLDIARKHIPRMARILSRVQATRAGNCKKIAQYCQKEVRRSATKGGRINKDVQARAKRAMKEMLVFWKKNEKEERELRKKAEKEALEQLRLEEERREAQRQARKLNFLITQTELYSHFIGRKIKGDTGEDDETAVAASEEATAAAAQSDETAEDQQEELDITGEEQALDEIDFDEDDEEKLREQARRSAQNALAKQREKTRAFDEGARERRLAASETSDISMSAAQLDTMNFQDPSSMGTEEIKQPSMLMCQLKSYQLKGLNWLANLYEQGINGILADEMGLGKTVQSISLMAYLAEVHNIWGPFLVIAPASTLHNWQQEVSKFVPSFRALPYWGNPKDRKVLRQFWNRKQLYGRDAPFHVVITSYQLVLTDVSYFQRVKWQYMVLDEAQAIKSSSSARWKQLLGFHCRNRLLLTGTPIQNSMQELWALLHFIMPTLFDSHEEFSEWFSKDIESHAENKGTLNEHQLRRLHMILKPFMLRRIKRNVQHELGEKIEVEVYCDLTARQRALYRGLKQKISISELLEKATSLNEESMDSLMNLVMQFRKVCNHPELFERADVQSPLAFCAFSETGSLTKESSLYCPYSSQSHIKYHIPKHLYRNGGILRNPGPHSNAGFSTRYLDNLMNIWKPDYIQESMYSDEKDAAFSFLRFIDTSPQQASYMFKQSLVTRWISYLSQRDHSARRRFYVRDEEKYPSAPINTYASFLISETYAPTARLAVVPGSVMDDLTSVGEQMNHMIEQFDQSYIPGARTVPIDAVCSDRSFNYDQVNLMFDPSIRACLFGKPQYVSMSMRSEAVELSTVTRKSNGQGIMTVPVSGHGYSMMKVPAMRDLILDSGKLATLDRLLEKLKLEGHRCLVYFQMTRMIDLFEEYISYKQYKYLRLDGSSKISDRRDMVSDWQTRPEIFIFLLSTRAGGLGINLTAADTVIFYDSDWNPTVDQQAMDRAHRLGQTKQVTVYRLITKGTIEERILQRAKQKDEIQKVVISGGEFKQVDFKPREIVSLLLDDEEMDNNLQMQLKRKAEEEEKKKTARPSKRSKKADKASSSSEAAIDRLMSAGGDTLPEDDPSVGASSSSSSSKKKSGRIGRPRTNISFTG
ncbi:SNF2 family N-terminal domain-containing protein [Zychaea mexicana]|uniref:SNF2 family N-terminal domain-containing protein n=1 Tax=Zychaea mexicana TaxID=64656 RepID=UPI0022FDC2E4|nr:SNF2 family N-terminal domain-containing protein [Zychaea mexicana]KAI9472879.1 SNF2 family N-terminal domain-containing protein [Zychaea mexicana]